MMLIRIHSAEIPTFRLTWTEVRPLAWLRVAFTRIRQRRVLATLDDRMLRDIGISRFDALEEANKPCWRR
jgi:uncharacterized protein YjiS (DUF1127 family)